MSFPSSSFKIVALTALLAPALSARAVPKDDAAKGSVFFERHVRPILVTHCYECHSEAEETQKGGLLLDRERGWLEGGDTGKAVVPGNLDASLLVAAIRRVDEDSAMPPKEPLAESDVKLLEQWILRGAPGPADDMGETEFSKLGDQDYLFKKAKEHWAFQPVNPVEPPKVDDPRWNRSAIDCFVFANLKENGVEPTRRLPDTMLVRRLAFDLTGLPPQSDDYERPIDDLVGQFMDSPQFGEHFARMWLDVARYADTAATYRPDTKTPHYYPYAFTYRDYVIDAFNADKPYDQFIREQLAADLMGFPNDAPEMAALGFMGVSPIRNKSADFVDDVIDATTRGFLGMTAACSRCHDHKFEPIPTADYYSLYGVFSSVERPEPWDIEDFPKIKGYEPAAAMAEDYRKARAAIDQEIEKAGNSKKKGNNRSVAESIEQTKLAELLLTNDGAPARAMAVIEGKKPVDPIVFLRGEPGQKGDRVPRRFLKILDPDQPPFNEQDSGRLDLANKIADPENPLTARVFVNRVWGALIGSYLVDTPSDFGLQGSAPTHPELLDWLAADFVANGWSLKHLVRTIVDSETYRQSSRPRPDLAESDPDNRLLARANAKRLQIEELRDSLLAVSGNLDPRMRGRSGELWGPDHSNRRTIYGYINRFNLDPTLRAFDFPTPVQSQEKRTESVVAPQALFTMNSPFVIEQSKALIDRLNFTEGVTREARINAVFQAVFHRDAAAPEHERIGKFIDLEKGRKVNPWPLLAQSLFMSNEFLYVD
ncbi:MAG: PSD1 domain-containing protein [Verrucomicrobiae bacterium]|nr:PSD1 domain-containing protein [Verrucomicrobiae bacterium]